MLQLDKITPNAEYLGHPINAYNLVKHVADGWNHFRIKINPRIIETVEGLNWALQRENVTNLPDLSEIKGAAFGVARLHDQYDLDMDKLAKDGVVSTNLTTLNMKTLNSEPGIVKFTSITLLLELRA